MFVSERTMASAWLTSTVAVGCTVEGSVLPLIALFSVFFSVQHYFIDPWNTFDFIIVVGSIIDIIIEFMMVS